MLDLERYISICESLDSKDNIEYKLGVWFKDNPAHKQSWDFLINKVKEKHRLDDETFNAYYGNFECIKGFVDFMTDNILSNANIDDNIVDYAYAFRQIIKIIAEV